MSKTVFMDRDGVINACPKPHDYVKSWDEFHFKTGAVEGVRKLNEAGYQVVVITNQRGIARGILTAAMVEDINSRMCRELEKKGAHIHAVFVCPHNEGECYCRKPEIGLFLKAEKMFSIDKKESWMIGDSKNDIEAGTRYGVRTLMIKNENIESDLPTTLEEAVNIIIESEQQT